jgi:competence protein ComEC
MKLGIWAVGLSIALSCSAARAENDDVMRVHFVDVAQGNATLVEFAHGVILVDAGGEEAKEFNGRENLMKYLKEFFARRTDLAGRDNPIDLLAITHPHIDHTCGVPDVISTYPPANIIHNHQRVGSGSRQQNLAIDFIRQGNAEGYFIVQDRAVRNVLATEKGISNDTIDPFGPTPGGARTDPEVTVLWGGVRDGSDWDHDDLINENNHSLVIRVDFGKSSVLFTGDLEEGFFDKRTKTKSKAGIERMVEAYRKFKVLDADVYLVGHHGSRNGGTNDLTKLISPEIAVISCGPPVKRTGTDFNAFNFGHPRLETIKELEAVVSGTRESAKKAKVFERVQKPIDRTIDKAIYCTGWDGTIVLEGTHTGDWTVKKLVGNAAFPDR